MALALGIHVGHDAACAVVRDGTLVAAVQLERISRSKHHAIASLSNVLPIEAVLGTIGASITDVDVIVSSFQAASVGGFGLDRPLIEPAFDRFDPFEARHHALSHHLAHAHCASAYAPPVDLAVIVSDYAGSATEDGADYALPFSEWYQRLTSRTTPAALKSECLSVYRAPYGAPMALELREFRTPNVGSLSHVCSVGALYENVTQAVFRRPHTHGSLMALAAYGEVDPNETPMVDVDGESVVFRNDWQHRVFQDAQVDAATGNFKLSFAQISALARRCQEATEQVLLAYAQRAARLTGSRHLAVGGGTFLNILGNTRLAQSGLFDGVYLPSAPHDAGIAVGAAFYGAAVSGDRRNRVMHDRLGPKPEERAVALHDDKAFVTAAPVTPEVLAKQLAKGRIVARCAGRSEFGPRALGARSLLASPLLATVKDRLNVIKGREAWRPVAPIVASEKLAAVFDGPEESPWMTFSHQILPEHRDRFPALSHPDDSTRAQTLSREQDPWLHDLLGAFEVVTGFPVLVNTSLNGPGEPILETPSQTLAWYLRHDDVDNALLDDILVERRSLDSVVADQVLRPAPNAFVLVGGAAVVVRVGADSLSVSSPALRALFTGGPAATLAGLRSADPELTDIEVWRLLVRRMLVWDQQ